MAEEKKTFSTEVKILRDYIYVTYSWLGIIITLGILETTFSKLRINKLTLRNMKVAGGEQFLRTFYIIYNFHVHRNEEFEWISNYQWFFKICIWCYSFQRKESKILFKQILHSFLVKDFWQFHYKLLLIKEWKWR